MSKWRQQLKTMHFPTVVAVTLLLFCSLLGYLIFSLGHYTEEDIASYQKLVRGDQEYNQMHISRQQRMGLKKDIFFREKDQSLQLHIESQKADLILERQEGKLEVVEQLNDVICLLQEELLFVLPDGRETHFSSDGKGIPVQKLVRLEANEASYFYKNEMFVAENVKVMRYLAAGHSLEEASAKMELLSDGLAKKVEFSLSGSGLKFNAEQFKAKFYGQQVMP